MLTRSASSGAFDALYAMYPGKGQASAAVDVMMMLPPSRIRASAQPEPVHDPERVDVEHPSERLAGSVVVEGRRHPGRRSPAFSTTMSSGPTDVTVACSKAAST